MMPEMDGFELLSKIQGDPETCLIPVIIMTALVEEDNQRSAMILGADDFIRKPFRKADLLQAIDTRIKKIQNLDIHLYKNMDQFKKTITLNFPHELLTPLNGILGFSEILYNGATTLQPEQVRKMAENINISGKRLHLVFEHFIAYLNLLRKNSGEFDNRPIEYPNDVIIGILAEVSNIHKRPYDLSINLKETHCKIGQKEFSLLIKELADNAFKFSRKGMPVTITAEMKNQKAHFSFHNFGSLFPPDNISKIGAYIQFDRDTYEQQGLGLGLAIVQLILEHYNGNIRISSDLETGTMVTVVLPG
jgi:signal transduction histidine kinase